jgi:hypothetical protein
MIFQPMIALRKAGCAEDDQGEDIGHLASHRAFALIIR